MPRLTPRAAAACADDAPLIETIDEPGAAYEADRAMLDLVARAIDID